MIISPDIVVDPEPQDCLQCPGCGYNVWYSPRRGWDNVVSGGKCVSGTSHNDHVVTLRIRELEGLY